MSLDSPGLLASRRAGQSCAAASAARTTNRQFRRDQDMDLRGASIAALAAAALLFAIAFRDRLLPATEVEVPACSPSARRAVPLVAPAPEAAAGARDGSPDLPPAIPARCSFRRAAGFVLDPLPIKATALTSGACGARSPCLGGAGGEVGADPRQPSR
ncbi:MAG: hypothetical protein R3F11_01750 [Verrucomicrobiales bacterium]